MPEIERHDLNYLQRNEFFRNYRRAGITDPALLMELWRTEVNWARMLVEQHDVGRGRGDFTLPNPGGGQGGGGPPPYTPPEYCVSPAFTRQTYTGTINNGTTIRKSFTSVAGVELSFYLRLHFEPTIFNDAKITLYDTDGVTVLKTVTDNGVNGTTIIEAVMSYTFAGSATYFVDFSAVGSDVEINDYTFTIATGRSGFTSYDATHNSLWRQIYVASTNRIFLLSSFENTTDSYITVLNSITGAQVAQVLLATALGTYTNVVPILFYNPTDNSVWCCHRQADESTSEFLRLNPSTGAIVEHIGVTTPIVYGEYNPISNKLYGIINIGGGTTINVYDCALRGYDASLVGPAYTASPHTFTYYNGSIYITNDSTSATAARLYKITSSDTVSFLPLTHNANMQDNHCIIVDGIMYTSRVNGGKRTLVQIDIATGTMTDILLIDNIRTSSVSWDLCQNTINYLLLDAFATDTVSYVLRLPRATITDGVIEGIIAVVNSGFNVEAHGELIWNPDMSKTSVLTGNTHSFI